jgi:hypothetical protein
MHPLLCSECYTSVSLVKLDTVGDVVEGDKNVILVNHINK